MCIEDESLLASTTNFQIFMAMMGEKEFVEKKQMVLSTLSLLFPKYNTVLTPRSLVLNNNGETVNIDEGNFEVLQKIVSEIFCLA